MLLRILVTFSLSFSVFAHTDFKLIKDKDNLYKVVSSSKKYPVRFTGVPELKGQRKLGSLYIIDYYSGEQGTSKIIKVYNRLVLKSGKVIVHAPYKYTGHPTSPSWKFDEKNKQIIVKDPMGVNIKRNY